MYKGLATLNRTYIIFLYSNMLREERKVENSYLYACSLQRSQHAAEALK